jgi:hypothetical protein
MKRQLLIIITLLLLNNISHATPHIVDVVNYNDNRVNQIAKYVIQIPENIKQQINLDNPGVGSGLIFKNKDEKDNLWFYSITDRGANIISPSLISGEITKIFHNSKFAPFISLIKVAPSKIAQIEKIIKLQATGLPTSAIGVLAHIELPLDINYNKLGLDPNGIDSEALDIDAEGNFWVADEYRPALMKFSPSGKLLDKIDMNNGLPPIIKHRLPNRGFESMVIAKTGNMIFALESILNVNNETRNAKFIRVFKFDPVTRKSKSFAYFYDDNYINAESVKLGDITALNDNEFLIIEQGKNKNNKVTQTIYHIDLKDATDISNVKLSNNKDLEYASKHELNIIKPIHKKHILSMQNYNWNYEKMEGIAVIDPSHIAVVNDNDFNYIIDYQGANDEISDNYTIDLSEKRLLYNNKITNVKLGFKKTFMPTELWVIELKDPLY